MVDGMDGGRAMIVTTNDMKNLWPVLGSLVEIPSSAQALARYALDQKNPVTSRFAAFHALRYVDKNEMKTAGEALQVEFSSSKKAKAVVSWIEDDNQAHPNMGTMWFYNISK